MSDNTKIEWTEATWNIITGCSVVSAGCKHCYAMKLAGTRLQHHPSRTGLTIETANGPVWNGETRFNAEWLDQPLKWKRPRKIFVCAHGDLFHESVPDEWIDQVFALMALAKQHTFQVLTKRPERMKSWLTKATMAVNDKNPSALTSFFPQIAAAIAHPQAPHSFPLPNVWLGVSVENQAAADERIPLLLQTPAAVRWISAEPLLGPVDLERIGETTNELEISDNALTGHVGLRYGSKQGPAIDWVVVGGESGPNARPMHPDWARSLRDQCATAGVPFLFKQWGEWLPDNQNPAVAKPHDNSGAIRVGKKRAGRLLDSVEHNGYPSA